MKTRMIIAATAAMILGMSGCAGGKEPAPGQCVISGTSAPKWACGIEKSEGRVVAVGSAEMTKAGHEFTRRTALASARSNLAQQIETLIKDKVETFTRATGVGKGSMIDNVSTQVSKQVAKVTLRGSEQINYWQHPDNETIFVLVGIDKNAVMTEAKKNVISSFKRDDALWQQFQAKNALEELEKEFAAGGE